MGRIVRTGSTPAKRRHQHRRSCAEVLRLLAKRNLAGDFDREARDMVAFLVWNLHGIYRTIDESAQTWDEKGYWRKAEGLRDRWLWARTAARELEEMIRSDRWEDVAPALVPLVPQFQDVTVRSITRNADWWCGAHRALLNQSRPASAPPTEADSSGFVS
ncbi:hypothetical protein CRI94_15865 [Longibacter salinarum]|uniref:Uncharacterized protein n=1 Tax=Longibacter salinarum TaxID=1850348 RepID=A0A2A8CU40_9BACT|nr:hypothetical protein [Longibacter salinarum]PEN11266.1 hypothetical protein CRI94_15865 [Longibacter salinarum]